MSWSLEPNQGFCLWLTGLPSAGKTTIARTVIPLLQARGFRVELLDGDEVRRGLSADLGFDRVSRERHAERVSFVSKLLVRNGVVPVVALISPYRASRAKARAEIGRFAEVYIRTPLDECERRDVKGLYKKARAGVIHEFTGVDDPYEPPEDADIIIDTLGKSPEACAGELVRALEDGKWISPKPSNGRSRSGKTR